MRAQNFTGGCYHLAFFMTRYLAKKGINVTPIIGWVNDGTWQGVTSHGWIEFNGKTTDASLTRTDIRDIQPRGDFIVLDRILRPGDASYSYHKNEDPFVASALNWMRLQPTYASILLQKEIEHQTMISISSSHDAMDSYLSRAPRGSNFQDFCAIID